MTAFVGRKAILKKGLITIAAVRSRTATINNEPVDVTSDDDNGFRTLLADPGTKTMDISFEGVAKDATMLTLIMSTTDILDSFSILFPTIGTLAGDFVVTSFEMGAPYNEAGTFSCSLQSSGAFTFTAA
jgi:predicted secreted protein